MAKSRRASKAQERLVRNALGGVIAQTFVGAIGAAARGQRNERGVQPRAYVPPSKSKGRRGR